MKYLNARVEAINNLLNRSWTESEIQEKLRRSGVLASRAAPVDRNAIEKRRKDAVAQGDEAAVAKCDADLVALEGPKLAFGTSLQRSISTVAKPPSQQDRLAALNRQNRKTNAIEIRKAQLAEKRAEAESARLVARGEALANPFARVKTRAKVMHDVRNDSLSVDDLFSSDRSRGTTPVSVGGAKSPSASGTPKRGGTPTTVAVGTAEKKKGFFQKTMEDDVIASLDLGIDIEI